MSDETEGKLFQVRELWKDWLEGDEYFNDIEVLDEKLKDLNTRIRTSVAKLGLCVVLATPTTTAIDKKQRCILLNATLVARVYRHATACKNPKQASAVAERIIQRSHGFFLDESQQMVMRITDHPIELSEESGDEKTPVVAYDAAIETPVFLNGITWAKVATPTITYQGTTVEILCDTPGAQIYYTTNGKTPTPANGTRYTGQFTIADPTTLKARAGDWGKLPSDVAQAIAGVVIPPEEDMTFDQWLTEFNARTGNCKFDVNCNLVLLTDAEVAEEQTLHQVKATKLGTDVSVVADPTSIDPESLP